MDEAKLLKSIKKIVDESINGNIKKIVDESINGNIKKIVDESINGNIKKIVDESINGNIKKIVDESINDNIKKILDEALVPIKKDIEDLKIGLKKTNERIDYYHKPIEPSMTELMPLKSVISLSVLREPTLKWIEKMYKEILRQIQSKKYKGIWINTPKKWYQQTLELFKEVDSKNLFEITTWNDITVT